ncbi:MAG: hypothetical protein LUH07_01575 [Lachnospiraceae bacterium]|nr:hypothetical protein [Lachnospiraceae bacterium]
MKNGGPIVNQFVIKISDKRTEWNKHWQYCVGSGHAAMALRTDYAAQLKRVHEELGIKYVRFHGILNDDMEIFRSLYDINPIKGAERFKQVSFRKVGLVYDNVLACGMKPFVELSFMPTVLADQPEKRLAFYYGGCISRPRDDEEWKAFIQAFVKYLIGRYGKEEVESWPFEVWNEPDVFVFWGGTKTDYYHLYEVTARAIKEVDSDIQVGGPAASGSKWVGSFLAFCKENKVPVDFITVHQYAGDPIGGVESTTDLEEETRTDFVIPEALMEQVFASIPEGCDMLTALRMYMPDKSETEDIPPDAFAINSAIVKEQAGDIPIYYTEWNANGIFAAETNDTRKVAAYLVRTALKVEKNMTGSSVWCFSDIFEEFSNFPQEFHGGFGLLSNNGIPKPQYQALRMLGNLPEKRIDLGEGALDGEIAVAAFEDDEKIQLVLVREKMKSLALAPEKITLQIEMEHAPKQSYFERIDENHCNPKKKWDEMGQPLDMTPAEIQQINEAAHTEKEAICTTTIDGYTQVELELGVNDVYFVTIMK